MTNRVRHFDVFARRPCRLAFALVLAFAVLFSALLPHAASALSLSGSTEASIASIVADPGSAPASSDDLGVTQHTGCACTTSVAARVEPAQSLNRLGLTADYPGPPRPAQGRSLAALLFKPPRV